MKRNRFTTSLLSGILGTWLVGVSPLPPKPSPIVKTAPSAEEQAWKAYEYRVWEHDREVLRRLRMTETI